MRQRQGLVCRAWQEAQAEARYVCGTGAATGEHRMRAGGRMQVQCRVARTAKKSG